VTERYIEFASSVGPPYGVAIRVHRVSYLDRSMVDRWRPDSIVGVFTSRSIEFLPVRGPTVKGLAEYLWVKDEQFPKVLASFSYDGGDVVVHAIYDLVLVWGDWGMGDRIFMRRLEYRVNKRTGLIVLRAHVVREIAGRGPTSTAARPLPEEARPLHLSQTLGQRLARRAQSR
jgi:hypothetical protein